MKLVFPTIDYKDRAIDFVNEFFESGTKHIDGSGGLGSYLREASYEEWLRKLIAYLDIANLPADRVPGLTYFCVREEDDRIVGMVDIRLALNEFIRNEAGHVGYCVRPSERRKGYATEILARALGVCERMGIERAIVSCDKDNIGSARTIQKNGGVLEAELYSEAFSALIQRYVIHLPRGN